MAKEDHPLRLGFLIHDVSRLRRTVVDKALRPMGVTRSQWWVLANLSRHNGDGMMQTELAKVMDVGKVTLGGLIDRLEATGLLKRVADPSDRRGVLLRHAADSARHRRAQFLEQPLSGGPGRDDKGILLVDRKELIHERSVPDDRQYGRQAA